MSTEFDKAPEMCMRLLIYCFKSWKAKLNKKDYKGKSAKLLNQKRFRGMYHSRSQFFRPSKTSLLSHRTQYNTGINNMFQLWRRAQVGTSFNRAAVAELKAKDEVIVNMQSQLRKAVAELHEVRNKQFFVFVAYL